MALIFDSPVTDTPIAYYLDTTTYSASPPPEGFRFDSPTSVGGSYIFDEVELFGDPPAGGALGAALYRHFQNLGIY